MLTPELQAQVDAAVRARALAVAQGAAAQVQLRAAAVQLRAAGVNLRAAAKLLGCSHQRVLQLARAGRVSGC